MENESVRGSRLTVSKTTQSASPSPSGHVSIVHLILLVIFVVLTFFQDYAYSQDTIRIHIRQWKRVQYCILEKGPKK